MKYIPLDKVISTIVNYYPINHSWMELEDFISKIYSIKTIDLSIIDEMIKEKVYRHNYSLIDDTQTDELSWAIKSLKQLKERLSLNK